MDCTNSGYQFGMTTTKFGPLGQKEFQHPLIGGLAGAQVAQHLRGYQSRGIDDPPPAEVSKSPDIMGRHHGIFGSLPGDPPGHRQMHLLNVSDILPELPGRTGLHEKGVQGHRRPGEKGRPENRGFPLQSGAPGPAQPDQGIAKTQGSENRDEGYQVSDVAAVLEGRSLVRSHNPADQRQRQNQNQDQPLRARGPAQRRDGTSECSGGGENGVVGQPVLYRLNQLQQWVVEETFHHLKDIEPGQCSE